MTGKMFKTCAIGIVMLCFMSFHMPCVQASITYETIMLTDKAAPGAQDGKFVRFGNPKINNAGQVAFLGVLEGPTIDLTNSFGIWSDGSGSLDLIVRKGDAAPDTPDGVVFGSFSFGEPVFNDNGKLAFQGFLDGTGVGTGNDSGLWSDVSGSVNLVVREGDAAPGTGSSFTLVTRPAFNNAGHTAFSGLGGIWLDTTGTLNRIVNTNDPVPGTGPGVAFNGFGITNSPPLLNDQDEVAFLAKLRGTGVDTTNDNGIWSSGSGALSLLAREGAPALGIEAGHEFTDSFGLPVFNNAGHTAFLARFIDPDVIGSGGVGIWSDRSGSLDLIARSGVQAPGTEAGVLFNVLIDPVQDDQGRVAFEGILTGPGVDNSNLAGIWSEGSGALQLLARLGSQAAGAAPGMVYTGFNDAPIMNGIGQTAFRGQMREGKNGEIRGGIWATDPNGKLHLVVQEGDVIDVNNRPTVNDFRIVSSVDLPNTDFRNAAFNDLGQLIYTLRFTDGSDGIFIATIPEPGSIMLFAAGIGIFYRRGH